MKKLLLIPLIIILAFSIVLGSCGETSTTTAPTTTAPTTTAPTTTAPTTTAPTTTAPTTTAPTTTPPTTTPPTTINWDEAFDHEGETATVVGPVVGVEDMGAGIGKYLVYLGDEFTGTIAMILYADIALFPTLADYVGKTIEVTGEIYINPFRSQAEIACTAASQIVIVESAAAAINWDEAFDHEGETATVVGLVVGVQDMGAGIGKYLIYLGDEFTGTIAMILYADAGLFPTLADYVGKTIEVTGEIYINVFRSQAEIACTAASQIVIVE